MSDLLQAEFVTNLEILDYLELLNSTVSASEVLGISQSSCSRRYRTFSDQCGFGFDRVGNQYRATSSLDVLRDLRQAAQRMRVRKGRIRSIRGWQFGNHTLASLHQLGPEIPIRPMNSWHVLSLLDQRLVDLAVMGIMEFRALLSQPLTKLRLGRQPLSKTISCIPLCLWDMQLIGATNHPLRGGDDWDPDVLSRFASPSLPIGMAPILMGELQHRGLGSQPCGLSEYDESKWEGFASNGDALSYGAPFLLTSMRSRYGVEPLNDGLGIVECLAVVGHRDVLADQRFSEMFKSVYAEIHRLMATGAKKTKWLH